MSCYDLKYLNVDGEIVGARPTAWDKQDEDGFGNDIDGEAVTAIEWMSTCPHCANLMMISVERVYVSDEVECAGCDNCGRGVVEVEEPSEVEETGLDESDAMSPEELVGMLGTQAEFVDPIAEGTFKFEIDKERTPGLLQSS